LPKRIVIAVLLRSNVSLHLDKRWSGAVSALDFGSDSALPEVFLLVAAPFRLAQLVV
jgi:hypothetical protein